MSEELPKRLFKPGEETEVHQINNNCKMVRYFKRLMEWLPKELETVKKDPELVDWDDDGGFWSLVIRTNKGISIFELWEHHRAAVKKWSNADRIIASFDLLCESIAEKRDKLKENPKSYVLDGFTYGLQIWAMEAIPKLGKLCGRKLNKSFKNGPRCVNWMGAAKISYEELNKLENILTPKDDIYPYISWTGNYTVCESLQFSRRDEVEDDRVKLLMHMIMKQFDFSGHNWEYEETPVFSFGVDNKEGEKDGEGGSDEASGSDEEFQTPKGSATIRARDTKGKKRLPDRGMEKRKHKVLHTRPQQAPFDEDMKTFVTQLFQQGFAAMEERLEKKMDEKFEGVQSELKNSRGDSTVQAEHGKPSPTKPSPSKPSPRRSKRLCLCTLKQDVNFSQADDMDEPIGTQSLEGLSQASYVPDFDPSQTNNDNDASDWWTPMTNVRKLRKGGSKQSNAPVTSAKWDRWTGGPSKKLQLSDSPMAADGSPQASLYYFTEESWDRFTKWSTNPTALRIGPSVFNLTFAQRIVCAGKWLGNEEMDAMMYIWREKTSLRRWNIDRVAFMNAMFCLQIEKEYEKCKDDKRGYVVPDLLLAYGRGELPSHGRTNRVWGVDVDRLYFPLFVNGNHWVAVCVNMIEKKVEVYDCNRGRNRQYVEKFACMIPRIVKAVGPPKSKLLLTSYSIVDMPMQTRLNKSCADCGAFALKHLECILLGLDLSLVEDGIMPGCRQKIAYDIWEAAHDPILIQLMAQHIPSDFESSTFYDLEED
ncbi:hypothetical protein YC2023_014403 [Brassica napus]